jgi:hypothetical protein
MEAAHLEPALAFLAEVVSITHDPWWVFGGAAFALLGAPLAPVSDIDVLVSRADAELLAKRYNWENQASCGNSLFQSTYFLKTVSHDMPVEFMAELKVKKTDGWALIEPSTRKKLSLGDVDIYVPDVADLADIFQTMGRPNDLKRASVLRHLMKGR